MAQNKIITQIDITCNIAFFDICCTSSKFYLLCCTGQQYPDYPCYGSMESGFTQHSSICRAALASGVNCGEQFFVYYIGETCRFPSTFNNGVKTLLYSEWSKSFKIKKANDVFVEHQKLRSVIDTLKKNDTIRSSKIKDLEFELEKLRLETSNYETKSKNLRLQLQTLTNQKISLANANKRLSSELDEANKYPKSEYLSLKRQRDEMQKKLLVFDRDKRDLTERNEELKTKINETQLKRKKNLELKELQKQMSISFATNELEEIMGKLDNIVKKFGVKKRDFGKAASGSNAMSNMKRILDLMSVLKVDVDDYNHSDDEDKEVKQKQLVGDYFKDDSVEIQRRNGNSDFVQQGIEKFIEKTKEKVKNNLWGDEETIKKDFLNKLNDLEKFSQSNDNLIPELNKHAEKSLYVHLWEPRLIQIQFNKKQTKSTNLVNTTSSKIDETTAETAYEQKKILLNDLIKRLKTLKDDRNIAEALKTSREIENLINNEILPENRRIRADIKENRKKNEGFLEKDFKSMENGFSKIDESVKSASEDLETIDKLRPIPDGAEDELSDKVDVAAASLVELEDRVGKCWETSKDSLIKFVEQVKLFSDAQLNLGSLKTELESKRFEILRWEETKADRKEMLKEFIKEKKKTRKYLEKVKGLITIGTGCLRRIENDRLMSVELKEKKLEKDYHEIFETLYNYTSTDLRNKERQLKRFSQTKTNLSTQLEDAVDLMDEDAVSSLKKQLNDLPTKEKILVKKIDAIKTKLRVMEKDSFYKKLSKKYEGDGGLKQKEVKEGEGVKEKLNERKKKVRKSNKKKVKDVICNEGEVGKCSVEKSYNKTCKTKIEKNEKNDKGIFGFLMNK